LVSLLIGRAPGNSSPFRSPPFEGDEQGPLGVAMTPFSKSTESKSDHDCAALMIPWDMDSAAFVLTAF
jgi:hypothetical protein